MIQRYMKRVVRLRSGCWRWTGAKISSGYGSIRLNGQHYLAHRLFYILLIGDLADDQQLRHTCDHPWCVNPKHLVPGTSADNHQDMMERRRHQFASRTACSRGHEYTPESTYEYRGRRHCRLCHRDRDARYRERRPS